MRLRKVDVNSLLAATIALNYSMMRALKAQYLSAKRLFPTIQVKVIYTKNSSGGQNHAAII